VILFSSARLTPTPGPIPANLQDSIAISEHSNAISQNSNAISQNSNAISQNSNAISQNSNAILQDSNVISEHSNAISQDSTVISEHSNAISQDSTVISQDSNAISQDSTVISQDSTVISQDSTAISEDSILASQNSNGLEINYRSGFIDSTGKPNHSSRPKQFAWMENDKRTVLIISSAVSTSSSVVNRPTLKRMQLWAFSEEYPIAVRTCDGSGIASSSQLLSFYFLHTAVISSV
jgi:hypothetical protein